MQVAHSHQPQHTAILLFSRTVGEESRVKNLDGVGRDRNRSIIRSMIKHSLTAAVKTGLPVFSCYSPQQKGESFGERLSNAIEGVFSQGFDRVITIGNDCPMISSSLILEAQSALDQNQLVLGPAYDGGVYLIGLHRSEWDRKKFLDLDWQTEHLQDSFSALSPTIAWLTPYRDLDHANDLQAFMLASPKGNLFLLTLQKILSNKPQHLVGDSFGFYSPHHLQTPTLRGPPC